MESPKPKKIAVKDVKDRIRNADSYMSYQADREQKLKLRSAGTKDVKMKHKLDSLANVANSSATKAIKYSDTHKAILKTGMAKKAKESAVVQKRVSSSLFKAPKPVKPTVLKKK